MLEYILGYIIGWLFVFVINNILWYQTFFILSMIIFLPLKLLKILWSKL